ncbi:23S rRNA pseudouridylate synthase [Corynebacterium sp. HMSC062E11]|nr:23S rRNA pseudouridylate synthase [Corynebacterium sp. HMSC062E11]OFK60341.1 23S rRNA pseudouridylate synthase [Corynebacterium sp. HMSC078A10]OFK94434.1 23S rRNA pseudouridylate synthase [Corynebacterium sp. HMSC068H04]OFL57751.1 23S rRNA pseudouridylate synthase [Corynebacterium sp. HMSC065D07]OFN20361.1 23S rRNA pseudouridylate synthase [Corynebacterium sp. HMSC055A01]OFP70941.1 23S rRNA pseudouridylate synthase [Corynebacterium sp. HMSC078C09]OFQ90342.1 23S rRNA pseudouridylate synthas
MGQRISQKGRGATPLPIRDGLNPTHARVVEGPITAWDFVHDLIVTQRHRHPDDNDAALQARFTANEVVSQDGTPLSPDSTLATNAMVYFYRMPAPETPVPYDIPILHEDEHLLVVDKPPFMATMPRARHITETATVRLRRMTGNNELSPAHRLDRLTSGILVFTKDRTVRGAYQTLFAERRVTKTYEAIAPLADVSPGTVWRSRMEKTPGELQGRIVEGEVNAITEVGGVEPVDKAPYEAIHGSLPEIAKYTLKPQTGKTHQLRLHMLQAGIPIIGDPIYPVIFPAEAEDMRIPMHLTATHISFVDPFTARPREFSSQLPLGTHHLLSP